jgi:hypothetical protein
MGVTTWLCFAGNKWKHMNHGRLSSMDQVAKRDQMRTACWQEKQYEVLDRIRCRLAAHDRSLHAGFAAIHHKPSFPWLSHKTKTWGRQRTRYLGVPRTFDAEGHTVGSRVLRRENTDCGDGVTTQWRYPSLDHIAPKECASSLMF